MAYVIMAYVVMAYIVMAYMVMAPARSQVLKMIEHIDTNSPEQWMEKLREGVLKSCSTAVKLLESIEAAFPEIMHQCKTNLAVKYAGPIERSIGRSIERSIGPPIEPPIEPSPCSCTNASPTSPSSELGRGGALSASPTGIG